MSLNLYKHSRTMVTVVLPALLVVLFQVEYSIAHKDGVNVFGQIRDKLLTDTANNVFDWVFGDPDDVELKEHEMEHHYYYLKDKSLPDLVSAVGVKNTFFLNFKAHDYDDNDKIDGNELFALIWHEKSDQTETGPPQGQQMEQQIALVSQLIDRLLHDEDLNNDGYLDFTEYSNARIRLENEHRRQ